MVRTTASQIRQQGRLSSQQDVLRGAQQQAQQQSAQARRQLTAQEKSVKERETSLRKLKPTRGQISKRGRAGLIQAQKQQRLISKEQVKLTKAKGSISKARAELKTKLTTFEDKIAKGFGEIEKGRAAVALGAPKISDLKQSISLQEAVKPTTPQARKLAALLEGGGMSIKQERNFAENIFGNIRNLGLGVLQKGLTPGFGVADITAPTKQIAPFAGRTDVQKLALPAEALEKVVGFGGPIIETGLRKLPESFQPEFGTAFGERAGEKITGGQVAQTLSLGAFAIPVVGEVLLGSEVAKNLDTFSDPNDRVNKILDEQIAAEEITREQITPEIIADITKQVKTNSLINAGLSSAFLAGLVFKKPFKSKTKVKQNNEALAKEIDSFNTLAGTSKDKVVNELIALTPDITIVKQIKKATDTLAYEVVLKNGKKFNLLEFSKIVNGRLEKQIIGAEVVIPSATKKVTQEIFIGSGKGVVKGGKSETVFEILKFEKVGGRTRGRRPVRGRELTILEKSELEVAKKAEDKILTVTASNLKSAAVVIRNTKAKKSLLKEADKFIENINNGGKVSTLQLKKLMNLGRKANGQRAFTEAEFNAINLQALSNTQIISIATQFKKVVQGFDTKLRESLVIKSSFLGRTETKGVFKDTGLKVSKTKTPFKTTFPKESAIVKRAKEIAKSKPFSKARLQLVNKLDKLKLKVISKPKLKTTGPSPAASLAAATPISGSVRGFEGFGGLKLPKFGVPTVSRVGFRSTTGGITLTSIPPITVSATALSLIDNQTDLIADSLRGRLDLLNAQESRLKNIQDLSTFQQTKLDTVIKQKQEIKLNLSQVLKLKQRGASRPRSSQVPKIPVKPLFPIIPPIPTLGKKSKGKLFKPVTILKGKEGYHAFVKHKGKFIRANKVPLTIDRAKNLAAWITDRTTSRTWKVIRTKKNPQHPKIRAPRNYFGITKQKWRDKIIKGKKVQGKNLKVERTKFAIDSFGEKKQLSAAREIKRLRKKATPIKFKKLKSSFGKKKLRRK